MLFIAGRFRSLFCPDRGTLCQRAALYDGLWGFSNAAREARCWVGFLFSNGRTGIHDYSLDRCALVADGDTGFGGLANVAQTVAGYERAGASAIQIEDQEFPKRCGHTRDRRVVDAADMQKKIKVAVSTRDRSEFIIIARTDARTQFGLDEALRRAEAYAQSGADALFVESPESPEELRKISEAFHGLPLVANMVAGGRTPLLSDQELFDMGFQLVIHPTYLLGAMTRGLESSLQYLVEEGLQTSEVAQFNVLNEWLDFESVWALDQEH